MISIHGRILAPSARRGAAGGGAVSSYLTGSLAFVERSTTGAFWGLRESDLVVQADDDLALEFDLAVEARECNAPSALNTAFALRACSAVHYSHQHEPYIQRLSVEHIVANLNATVDRSVTRRLWEDFVSGGAPDLRGLSPAIRASWLRSRAHGVSPELARAPGPVMPCVTDPHEAQVPWLACVEPAFALLRAALSEPHQVVLLTDGSGCVLRCHVGDKAQERARDLNIRIGADWSESKVGCTAIGACLADGNPVLASWCESYSRHWHDWVAQAAPLRDPATGQVIGGVNVSGFREILHPLVLELSLRTAEAVALAIDHDDCRRRSRILETFQRTRAEGASDACFALDRRGRLLAFNAAAARRYGLAHDQFGTQVGALVRFDDVFDLGRAHDDGFTWRVPARDGLEVKAVDDGSAGQGAIYIAPARSTQRSAGRWHARYGFEHLRGDDAGFKQVINRARRLATSALPLLLYGETGTGKELLAHGIHAASERRQGPFVTVNCGAIAENLIASELFGYAKGAFTGASREGYRGKFEQADGGTLFLDEITETSPALQVALLRVIQDGEVVPVGARHGRAIDVRIISATNRDPMTAVRDGVLRSDLYYRLNGAMLGLPPLRERHGDIALLITHFCREHGATIQVAHDALECLLRYPWPGNLRELHAAIRSAAALAINGVIEVDDLPPTVREAMTAAPPAPLDLAAVECATIQRALRETHGNVRRAASLLGLSRSSLYRKLAELRLQRNGQWEYSVASVPVLGQVSPTLVPAPDTGEGRTDTRFPPALT